MATTTAVDSARYARRDPRSAQLSNRSIWTGRVLTGLAAAFLAWDGAIKVLNITAVADAFTQLGYPVSTAVGVGLLELACLSLYLVPRTSVLGAVLLTGYLGGAISTHVRVGNPLFSHVLFPSYVALLVWGGLYLREPRLRGLLPLR